MLRHCSPSKAIFLFPRSRQSDLSAPATPPSVERSSPPRLRASAAQAGYVVVSGLARGIDTATHHASLETGTVAAMAGGLSACPPENAGLLDEIWNGNGLAISEMPFG
ncbi:Protein smf [Rhizobium favelukesii]|uniref:Protein smf n=1 Tax=Rhizobium favelukesii TaxID=348824 RepID=W6R8V8_9HYPH|nr:Protein smf [Rhizobium favelukesii]